MRRLDLAKEIQFTGVAELDRSAEGVIPLRFLKADLKKMGVMVPIARMGTGIEMQFCGRVRHVRLTLRCRFDDGYGIAAEWYWGPHKLIPTFYFKPGAREVVQYQFDFGSSVSPEFPLRMIFPTHCEVEVIKVEVGGDDLIVSDFTPYDYRQLPNALGLRWLLHGDSITQGANVAVPTMTWADLTAKQMGLSVVNLAIGGHGVAEECLAEVIAERTDFDFISLHIGTNALEDLEYPARLERYLRTILEAHRVKKVFLVSPIICLTEEKVVRPRLEPLRRSMFEVYSRLNGNYPQLRFIHGEKLVGGIAGLNADFVHLHDFGAIEYSKNIQLHFLRELSDQLKG